jgi:hypothetical protein
MISIEATIQFSHFILFFIIIRVSRDSNPAGSFYGYPRDSNPMGNLSNPVGSLYRYPHDWNPAGNPYGHATIRTVWQNNSKQWVTWDHGELPTTSDQLT